MKDNDLQVLYDDLRATIQAIHGIVDRRWGEDASGHYAIDEVNRSVRDEVDALMSELRVEYT
ncbi:MAG: hypothetical protein CMB80_00120 [Flammeovirgaceae bacterium]|jgi:hypothetical protein|nr:hypothetical protein [Flammeovirgaceae bacterium]